MMKASEEESKQFDKALDTFIELYNNMEADAPLISFTDDVVEQIEAAKQVYGEALVHEKINSIVREALSLVALTKDRQETESQA
ncbi:atypical membrane-integrating protein (Mistic protein) [Virgibacillus dokdonensis]|nr:atypical membrane-integrating protein (Mistic protein) [Virgibacillus dokdonensis]